MITSGGCGLRYQRVPKFDFLTTDGHGWTRIQFNRRERKEAKAREFFNHETHEMEHGFGLTQRRRIYTEGNEGNDKIQKAEGFYANFANYR